VEPVIYKQTQWEDQVAMIPSMRRTRTMEFNAIRVSWCISRGYLVSSACYNGNDSASGGCLALFNAFPVALWRAASD
jgi:hypothetical protein